MSYVLGKVTIPIYGFFVSERVKFLFEYYRGGKKFYTSNVLVKLKRQDYGKK